MYLPMRIVSVQIDAPDGEPPLENSPLVVAHVKHVAPELPFGNL